MTQIFPQSTEQLNREVSYLQPCSKILFYSGKILYLQKPISSLPKKRDYWDRTMKIHITKGVSMEACTVDGALYFEN